MPYREHRISVESCMYNSFWATHDKKSLLVILSILKRIGAAKSPIRVDAMEI